MLARKSVCELKAGRGAERAEVRESSQNRSCRRRRNPARTSATRMCIRKLVPSRRCAMLPLTSTDVAGEVVMSSMLLRAPFLQWSLFCVRIFLPRFLSSLSFSFQYSTSNAASLSSSSSSSLEVCMCSFSPFRIFFPRSPPFASSVRNDLSHAERALNRHLKSAPTPSLPHSECIYIHAVCTRARESASTRARRPSNDVRTRRVRSSWPMEDLHSSSSRIGNPTVRPDALK